MNFNFRRTGTAVPVDRPLEMILAAYAAGSLAPAFAALVGAHLELRPENRDLIASLELAGGIMLEDSEPVPLRDRERRLDAIFAGEPYSPDAASTFDRTPCHPAPLAADGDELLPQALRGFTGRDFDRLEWSEVVPGLRHCVIAIQDGVEASFVRCRAGKRLPRRDYRQFDKDGLEVTLVLQGGFGDAYGHYLRGAIAVTDEAGDQRIVVDPNEEGIFFVVRDSSWRLNGAR